MTMRKQLTIGRPDIARRSVPILASTAAPVAGEALESWDLTRFLDNPVIMIGHQDQEIPVAIAYGIADGPQGLTMTAQFPKEGVDVEADRAFAAIVDSRLRGVSVGFEPGESREETIDGKTVTVRSANVLGEVSFVAVPKDDGAGTAHLVNGMPPPPTLEPTEAHEMHISNAARALALHRQRKKQLRTDAGDSSQTVERYDQARLGRIKRTQIGGAKVEARVARTGILEYRLPDGTVRRELRLPEEVFHKDSLATLSGAPIIDIKDHTGMVTPSTFRKVTLGHTESVRPDGDRFIAAELHINDGETLARIDRKERTEISCGYTCRLDETPGVWNGQAYDVVQRGLRYNHVAVCPPNRGRSGPEVGLRLDSATAAPTAAECTTTITPEEEPHMSIKIRLDGKEYEAGSKEHLDAIDVLQKAEVETVTKTVTETLTAKHAAETTELKKELDTVKGRLDAVTETEKQVRLDAEKAKKKMEDDCDAMEKKAIGLAKMGERLKRSWRKLFGKDGPTGPDDADDDEDEKKLDAMTHDEIMIECIKKVHPKFDGKDDKGENRSTEYLTARFDSVMADRRAENGIDGVVRNAEFQKKRLDAVDGDVSKLVDTVDAARVASQTNSRDAWKNTLKGG